MTHWELTRMFCYVLAAPTLLYLALSAVRQHYWAQATMHASLALLFVWYVVEITIASTGVNTREYRVIGTPMIVAVTAAAVWMACDLVRFRRSAK